jgi:uncharacterized protein (UPF0218 family)
MLPNLTLARCEHFWSNLEKLIADYHDNLIHVLPYPNKATGEDELAFLPLTNCSWQKDLVLVSGLTRFMIVVVIVSSLLKSYVVRVLTLF